MRGEAASGLALGCGLPLAALLLFAGVAGLASGGATAALPVPLGPPGLAGTLVLDPVGLAFLVPLAILAGASFAVAEPEDATPLLAGLGATLLTLLAGDAFLLALGAGLAALATGAGRRVLMLVLPLAAVASLAPHAGLLQGDAFTELRSARGASEGAGAFLVFPCGIAAALILLWPVAAPARTGPGQAMFRDAALKLLGLFLLVRLLFDLGGQPAPVPAALLLALLAVGAALLAAFDALIAADLERVVAALGTVTAMLGAASIGLALLASSADLAPIVASGAAAGLLAAAALATALPLATLVCLSVREQAGSVRLASLGGLASSMPRTAAAFLLAAASLAALPPLAGFSALWLTVETLLALARGGGAPGLPVLLASLLVAIGLAAALAACAALRTGAVVFLGRPRTPRGAAAAETRPALLRPMIGLGAALLLLSLLPSALLRLLSPFGRALAGIDAGSGPLALASPAGDASFSPLFVTLLLAVLAAVPYVLRRRLGLPAAREVATWDGGAGPPPDWLPFGEPLAQASAATFVRGLPLPPVRLSARTPTASARLGQSLVARLRWGLRSLGHMPTGPAALTAALLAALAALVLAGGEAGWL